MASVVPAALFDSPGTSLFVRFCPSAVQTGFLSVLLSLLLFFFFVLIHPGPVFRRSGAGLCGAVLFGGAVLSFFVCSSFGSPEPGFSTSSKSASVSAL
jgi:hypothetical protein